MPDKAPWSQNPSAAPPRGTRRPPAGFLAAIFAFSPPPRASPNPRDRAPAHESAAPAQSRSAPAVHNLPPAAAAPQTTAGETPPAQRATQALPASTPAMIPIVPPPRKPTNSAPQTSCPVHNASLKPPSMPPAPTQLPPAGSTLPRTSPPFQNPNPLPQHGGPPQCPAPRPLAKRGHPNRTRPRPAASWPHSPGFSRYRPTPRPPIASAPASLRRLRSIRHCPPFP